LALLAILGLFVPTSLLAQSEADLPVTLENAYFPMDLAQHLPAGGGWLPLYVEMKARGDEEQAVTIEAVVQEILVDAKTNKTSIAERFSTRSRFDVPPGSAARRAWLYIWIQPKPNSQHNVQLKYITGSQSIAIGSLGTGGVVDVSIDEGGVYPLLVVGGRPDEVSPFGQSLSLSTNRNNRAEITNDAIARVEPHQLPDRILGYHSVRQIILRGFDESRLEESQLEALKRWVYLGGSVIFAPSDGSTKMFEGSFFQEVFQGLLKPTREREAKFRPDYLYFVERAGQPHRNLDPYAEKDAIELRSEDQAYVRYDPFLDSPRFHREIRSIDLETLEKKRRRNEEEPEPPDPLAGYNLEAGEFPGKRLYTEVSYGAGTVGAILIDDQTFDIRSSGELRQALWRKLYGSMQTSGISRWQHDLVKPEIHTALKDKKRDVGTLMISSIIVFYLLLVGPGLYFFLKRKQKLPSIIWVEPVVIVVYVGVIFAMGYLTKGYLTKTRLVTFFHQREGESFALRDSWMSIFSADDVEYFIQADRGELFAPVFANANEVLEFSLQQGQGNVAATEESEAAEDRNLSLQGYKLDLWQMGVLMNAGIETVDGRISVEPLEAAEGASTLQFRIRNTLPWRIRAGRFYVRNARESWAAGREIEISKIESNGAQIIEVSSSTPSTAFRDPDDEDEDVEKDLPDEVVEAFTALRDKGLAKHSQARMRLWVLLERDVEDFRVDRETNVTHKYDFYVLYGS